MPAVHAIRLRGPWGCQALARFDCDDAGERHEATENLPPAGRLTMPADWSGVCGDGFCGRVRLRRRFHWPARLMPRERVWLVFECVVGSALVRLNDETLGELAARETPQEFDITERLAPTNVLLVDVTHPSDGPGSGEDFARSGKTGGLTGEVRLEVRTR